ncbi:MAG: hypothetical protein G5663_04520 [Serratia symbiotica]|nr:hypothetical protein [Serratia symbiotica]
MDETAFHACYCEAKPSLRRRTQHYSNMAMTSVLMLKRIYRPDTSRSIGLRRLHFYTDKSAVEQPRLYLHQ